MLIETLLSFSALMPLEGHLACKSSATTTPKSYHIYLHISHSKYKSPALTPKTSPYIMLYGLK